MKKTKSKSIFTGVSLAIFSTAILLGVFALLFVGVVKKNGFPQVSQAANKKTLPFICSGCGFNGSDGNGDLFSGKDLTDAYLVGLSLRNNIDMSNAILVNANLSHAQVGQSDTSFLPNFTNVDFTNANLNGISANGNNFTGAKFSGTTLTNSNLFNSQFTNADFTNANLTGSTFGGNNFFNAIWSNTTCSDGTNSNNDGNTCIGHLNGQ